MLPNGVDALNSNYEATTLAARFPDGVFIRGSVNGKSNNSSRTSVTVAMEGKGVLGVITVNESTTVYTARALIASELDNVPAEFKFLFQATPIAARQERSTLVLGVLSNQQLTIRVGSPFTKDTSSLNVMVKDEIDPVGIIDIDMNADGDKTLVDLRQFITNELVYLPSTFQFIIKDRPLSPESESKERIRDHCRDGSICVSRPPPTSPQIKATEEAVIWD